MNVFEFLASSARSWPERPAIIEGDHVVRHDDLWREVDAMPVQLRRLGVGEGQGVGVMARNGSAFVIAALGAPGCGAVVMPLHHQLAPDEVTETLTLAPLATVICDSKRSPATALRIQGPGLHRARVRHRRHPQRSHG